ncbi:PHB depolymerase family esterase [uncultured Nevskia sp.]|uniref:alpha/beta hydrolase family esterase n=1 Tax=uncultured Nevskia sp. TaxID=228950 RepID=UPI0025D777FF|nr:PHB depolymerase family esterase [uncultured Nevskia sp.]
MRSFQFKWAAILLIGVLAACTGSSEPIIGDGTQTPPAPSGTTGSIDPVDGYLTTDAPIGSSTVSDGVGVIRVADGTTATSMNLDVNGVRRRYVVMRPTVSSGNAPVLILLHPSLTAPESMANLTKVSEYVLTRGFWAVMPEAIGGSWQDDPSGLGDQDVPFISALIDKLVADGGVDASRFYAAGFSSGGFMAERLACDLSDKIAAFGVVSAALRSSLAAVCFPAKQRAKVYFLGTADLIVPYNGLLGQFDNGIRSAASTIDFWTAQQQCNGDVRTTPIPDTERDGTTAELQERTGCTAGTQLQLYTLTGGGHAWPGGESTIFGVTSQDIAATGLIWRFVNGYRR